LIKGYKMRENKNFVKLEINIYNRNHITRVALCNALKE